MPSNAAGTAISAVSHTSLFSSKPVIKKAMTRTEMLVMIAKPIVARNCSLLSPRCER